MVRYVLLDTSVAVRILYGQSPSAAAWFDAQVAEPDVMVLASRLLRTELTRVLRRDGRPVLLRDQIIDYVYTIPLTEATLTEAEAIVPHLKTLDSIHLASLIGTGLDATVATHDERMKSVAQQIGYNTIDPVTG